LSSNLYFAPFLLEFDILPVLTILLN